MARIRAIDLFCCAGGSSWGAKAAGVSIIAGFDQWKLAGKVFKSNFPKARFYPGDLEKSQVRKLAEELGDIDLILASPECTNHSVAKGKKRRSEKSRETAFQVIRFARAFKSRWIVIENVGSMKKWRQYKKFKAQLEALGYKIREQRLNSADFKVPQQRKRLFLLCDREMKPNNIPKIGGRRLTASSFINLNGHYRWSALKQKNRAKPTLKRAKLAEGHVGTNKPFLLVYYGSDVAGGWQRLNRPLRTVTTVDRFAVVKPSAKGHKMRMLQVPELQAAMGMEEMRFLHGTRRDKIKMIGNAVCPPVMQHVVSSLISDPAPTTSND
ncbi:MAG: DNA cytosine methyltransferase [Acidobacteriota bacterium]